MRSSAGSGGGAVFAGAADMSMFARSSAMCLDCA
jgi:hypothetical protein